MSDLPEQQQRFVERQVQSGRFPSAQAVLTEAVHLLQAREERLARLDAMIAEGMDDIEEGDLEEADAVFFVLEGAYRPPVHAKPVARGR